MKTRTKDIATLAVHAGNQSDSVNNAIFTPIVTASSFIHLIFTKAVIFVIPVFLIQREKPMNLLWQNWKEEFMLQPRLREWLLRIS